MFKPDRYGLAHVLAPRSFNSPWTQAFLTRRERSFPIWSFFMYQYFPDFPVWLCNITYGVCGLQEATLFLVTFCYFNAEMGDPEQREGSRRLGTAVQRGSCICHGCNLIERRQRTRRMMSLSKCCFKILGHLLFLFQTKEAHACSETYSYSVDEIIVRNDTLHVAYFQTYSFLLRFPDCLFQATRLRFNEMLDRR